MKTLFVVLAITLPLAACSVDYQPEVLHAMHEVAVERNCDPGTPPLLIDAEVIPRADWVFPDAPVRPGIHWAWTDSRGRFIVYQQALYVSLNEAERREVFKAALIQLTPACQTSR